MEPFPTTHIIKHLYRRLTDRKGFRDTSLHQTSNEINPLSVPKVTIFYFTWMNDVYKVLNIITRCFYMENPKATGLGSIQSASI